MTGLVSFFWQDRFVVVVLCDQQGKSAIFLSAQVLPFEFALVDDGGTLSESTNKLKRYSSIDKVPHLTTMNGD